MTSGLSKIGENNEHPIKEYTKWLDEVKPEFTSMSVASLSKDFGVLNRTIKLRSHNQNGFVFATEKCSRKYIDMLENPIVAATILWSYRLNNKMVTRQVRVNGTIEELTESELSVLYEEEPLFCKIRCKICKCGEKVDWDDLKRKHDETLRNVIAGTEKLERNESYTGLRIIPNWFEFYFSNENEIADRIIYTLDKSGNWSNERVCV